MMTKREKEKERLRKRELTQTNLPGKWSLFIEACENWYMENERQIRRK